MTNEQTAVAVATPTSDFQPREVIRLGNYDRTKYNVLIPGAFTSQVTPFLVPVVRECTLDPDPDHGEVYVQEWTKRDGQFVPKALGINALGLANLANLMGILEIPQASGRVDDGRDPGVCTYRSTMFVRLPDGQPIIRTRELTLELATLFEEIETRITKKGAENRYQGKPDPWKPERIAAEIKKEQILAKRFFHRKAETGAKSRTHRVMLGIRSKYSPEEIRRPFVLAAVVPDVNQPEMRERMLDQATSSIGMLFGGGNGDVGRPMRQLAAGATAPAAEQIAASTSEGSDAGSKPTAEELAELAGGGADPDDAGADDDAAEDPRGSAGADVPEWAQAATAATSTSTTHPAKPLFEAIAESAAASGLKGPALKPQVDRLQQLFGGLDWDTEILPGLRRSFGEAHTGKLSAPEANALITAADSFDSVELFYATWRQAVAS